ncbi:MAG: GreA/GreB family elongation factor [Gallionella sp.]|nr:GreA/GreB family elongation factor [Gallionella sp.]
MSTFDKTSDRRVWEKDFRQLERIARSAHVAGLPVARSLLTELKNANRLVSDRTPTDVVTLNNWVTFRDEENNTERRLLVLPTDFRDFDVHLSVLSPLGAALVGMQAGSSVSYVDLEGAPRVAKIEAIGADNFFKKKGLEVGLCTLALLAVWFALAYYTLS